MALKYSEPFINIFINKEGQPLHKYPELGLLPVIS
jgi:hypothetical protein